MGEKWLIKRVKRFQFKLTIQSTLCQIVNIVSQVGVKLLENLENHQKTCEPVCQTMDGNRRLNFA